MEKGLPAALWPIKGCRNPIDKGRVAMGLPRPSKLFRQQSLLGWGRQMGEASNLGLPDAHRNGGSYPLYAVLNGALGKQMAFGEE